MRDRKGVVLDILLVHQNLNAGDQMIVLNTGKHTECNVAQ